MTRSPLLVQLSDSHIGAAWGGADPAAGLAAVVEEVRRLPDRPDAVLITGDVADTASDAEYEHARALLAPLGAPVYALPGNHDDRRALRRHFGLPNAAGTPVQYAFDVGPLRVVALDTTRPGEDRGELGADRLAWLEAELGRAPDRITLLAMHHPPLVTGSAAWDEIGLPGADREALGDVVGRHPQVRAIVGGHLHQTITTGLAGRSVIAAPSTYLQARLDLSSPRIEVLEGPSGFAVHALMDGEVISHLRSLD
jgi:3',5'-cyclic AMP phosphodiesterase CpdA